MRKRLEKYPADFTASYNLASLLQVRGKTDEAIANYQAALRTEPNSATACNSLGGALLAKGETRSAIAEFREALRIDRTYSNARYNLASTLASGRGFGRTPLRSISSFLKEQPDDAASASRYGCYLCAAEAVTGRRYPFFREAARLKPDDADTWSNFGYSASNNGRSIRGHHRLRAGARDRSQCRNGTKESFARQSQIESLAGD